MWRGILGVVVGFVLWSFLWIGSNQVITRMLPSAFRPDGGTNSTGLLLLLLVLSVIFSLIAGYLTAAIANQEQMRYVWGLAIALLLVGILVQAQFWTLLPVWYHLIFLALLIPACLAGGWWRLAQSAG